MLITKELNVRISGNVRDYYIKNNIEVNFNQVNTLPINLVNPQSHLLVDAKCDICNKEVKIQYRRYNQYRQCS